MTLATTFEWSKSGNESANWGRTFGTDKSFFLKPLVDEKSHYNILMKYLQYLDFLLQRKCNDYYNRQLCKANILNGYYSWAVKEITKWLIKGK